VLLIATSLDGEREIAPPTEIVDPDACGEPDFSPRAPRVRAGLLGGYILIAEFVLGGYPPRLFIAAHVHLLLVGFVLMNPVSGSLSRSLGVVWRTSGERPPHWCTRAPLVAPHGSGAGGRRDGDPSGRHG
jgi:hypothetical protein